MTFDHFNNFRPQKILVILAILFRVVTYAQTEPAKDSIVEIPAALAIQDIANYGEQTRNLVQETEGLIKNKPQLTEIRYGLTVQDSILSAYLNNLRDTTTNYNLDQLELIEDRITISRNKVTVWTRNTEKWREKTDDFESQIEFNHKVWSISLDSIKAHEKEIRDSDSLKMSTLNRVSIQIDKNLIRVFSVRKALKNWNDQLTITENSISVVTDELNEAFALLSFKRAYSMDNIWVPEFEPIWSSDKTPVKQFSKSDLRKQFDQKVVVAKRYIDSNSTFYHLLLFSFFLILTSILFINKKAKTLYEKNPEFVDKGAIILRFPFLSSLIILAFTIFLFYDFPSEVKYFVLMILILPYSILIWNLNAENKIGHLLIFLIFSTIFVLLSFITSQANILRFVLLIINIITFLLASYLHKNSKIVDKEHPYWLGTVSHLFIAIQFLSVIAFLANSIGSVQLSLIFTRITIGTILAFAIIKETIQLVEAFLYLVLMGPLYKYSNILKEDSALVLKHINNVLRISGYLLWFYTVLDLLKIENTVITTVLNFINTPLVVGELSVSLGNILSFFIILQASIWLSKFIRYFLDKEIYPRTKISTGVSSTFSLMIKYTITFVGFLFALFAAGIELSKVAVGIGALGVGVGFGLQNIVNNFVSGIILALERPIKMGDVVMVEGVEGIVKNIGLRASQIRTWDGSDVIVPNGSLISGNLTNRTFDDKLRRLVIELELDKDSNIQKASQVFLEASNSVPGILKDPNTYYNFEGIRNGKAIVKLYGWIADYSNGMGIGTAFKIAVFEALTKEGFEISFPVLHVKQDTQENSPTS